VQRSIEGDLEQLRIRTGALCALWRSDLEEALMCGLWGICMFRLFRHHEEAAVRSKCNVEERRTGVCGFQWIFTSTLLRPGDVAVTGAQLPGRAERSMQTVSPVEGWGTRSARLNCDHNMAVSGSINGNAPWATGMSCNFVPLTTYLC
jgi:hypothetical protein